MILTECVLGCKKAGGSNVLAKNRDRTYDSEVALIHHIADDLEYVILFDPKTNYIEGYNATSGIAIMNVALMNGADFGGNPSNEGKRIFSALLNAKSPLQAAARLALKDQPVYGSTFAANSDEVVVLEHIKNKKPRCLKCNVEKFPVVRSNHSEMIKNGGYSPEDGDDYISSKVRQATGEVVFNEAETAEDILDALSYPLFGQHSAFDTQRDTNHMRTTSQMAIDISNNKVLFRNVPGHGKLAGVYRTGTPGAKPKIDLKVIEYKEPTSAPFELWDPNTDNFSEGFDLAKYIDPNDEYDDPSNISDIEIAQIDDRTTQKNISHYQDRENEIIKMILSLQQLLKNKDGAMMHMMKDRDVEKDRGYLSDMLADSETSAMELSRLSSKLRAKRSGVKVDERKTSAQSILRKTIRKMLIN